MAQVVRPNEETAGMARLLQKTAKPPKEVERGKAAWHFAVGLIEGIEKKKKPNQA